MAKTSKKNPDHVKNLVALKRIEGQVRGLQRMIETRRYCVDILVQVNSVVGALQRVQDDILENHLNHCFGQALKGKSEAEKEKKVNEVLRLLKKVRKT